METNKVEISKERLAHLLRRNKNLSYLKMAVLIIGTGMEIH